MVQASQRDLRLDGLRGLATVVVVASHYLAEVPSGISGLAMGHVAVTVFFVLSGFLIGRLILERGDSANFFGVFYARRMLRTLPSYAVVLAAVVLAGTLGGGLDTGAGTLPIWSYTTFMQNVMMGIHGTTGNKWLAPTWTLAVEEQFYLVAPLAIVFLPRAALLVAVVSAVGWSISYRLANYMAGEETIVYLATLLANADQIAFGVCAALLLTRLGNIARFDRALEVIPLACLLVLIACGALLPKDFVVTVPLRALLGVAAAAFILRLAVNRSCSDWLAARLLLWAGHNSYSVYLVHMGVAGLVHSALVGDQPDIGSGTAWVATVLSFVATAAVATLLTKFVEEPCTALGRRCRWSTAKRGELSVASVTTA